jgi:bacterioferritin (cytochrome b1)
MSAHVISLLNNALAWELRAQVLYAHYSAYVRGIQRLHLAPHFDGESTESVDHARQVREAIAKLGGQAIVDRDPTPILHTEDWQVMLQEALKTEEAAAESYAKILAALKDDEEMMDVIQQIAFAEQRSVTELRQLIG